MKKLLIGYIGDGKAGGVDKYILNFISNFAEKYKIDVLTNRIDSELQHILAQKGISLIEVANLKHPLKQYKDLKMVFSKGNYDICYGAVSTAMPFLLMYSAKKAKVVSRIIHSHASNVDGKKEYEILIKRMLHYLCKPIINISANRYFACSEIAADWMYTKKNRSKVCIIPNCIRFEDYYFDEGIRDAYRKKYGIEDKIVLGHVSNFLPPKNSFFLVELLAKMKARNFPVVLLLVGAGGEKELLLNKIKELGLEKDVLDLGFQKDVTPFYQMMDFFVLPSNFESFSYVTLEAEISGLFCLISDRVPDNAVVSKKCRKLSIDNGATMWCDIIVENLNYNRSHTAFLEKAQIFNESIQKESLWGILEETV